MRRIAIINQKGGVGKTTTAVNLGAALARLGRRVLVIDMDPQANASTNLGVDLAPGEASTYTVLLGSNTVGEALRTTRTPGLWLLPAHLDLSGAELELAGAIGRETILRDALDDWARERTAVDGVPPVDYVLLDNPPSLGLLSINGLAASDEVLIAVQTEFFALQGLSKLVEVVQLLRRKLNPKLEITGVLACLYDSRLRLAREVLAELRAHFPVQCFRQTIGKSVKLAECPSFAQTIFEYAPESPGAKDHLRVAAEVVAREVRDPELAARALPTPDVEEVERALAEAALAAAPSARPAVVRAPRLTPERTTSAAPMETVTAAAPEPVAPEPVAPEPVAPEPVAPEPVAPENVAPENVAPENVAPEDVAPEDVALVDVALVPPTAEPLDERAECATEAEEGVADRAISFGFGVVAEAQPPAAEGDEPSELHARTDSYETFDPSNRVMQAEPLEPSDRQEHSDLQGPSDLHELSDLHEPSDPSEPAVELVPAAPLALPPTLPVFTRREYLGEERAALPSRRGPRRA